MITTFLSFQRHEYEGIPSERRSLWHLPGTYLAGTADTSGIFLVGTFLVALSGVAPHLRATAEREIVLERRSMSSTSRKHLVQAVLTHV